MSETLEITQPWIWLPTKIPGCTAWFDGKDPTTITADESLNVTQWTDKTGLGNNATRLASGYGPLYVGGSNLVFDGDIQYLITPYTANPSAESLFIVGAWTGTTSATSYDLIGASATNGREYAVRHDGTSNTVRWQVAGSATGYSATAGVTTAPFLTTGLYSGGQGSTSLNGSNMSAATGITFSGSATTNIGTSGTYTNQSNFFKGTINEIIFYNRQVTNVERQQIEGYLAYKWGIQSNLPLSQPYKINPPFQNTFILPTVPSLPIKLSNVTPSAQFSGATNKISANVFTPLSLSNYGTPCLYWYDCQDSNTVIIDENDLKVMAWNDKSVNGYNLLRNGSLGGNLFYETDSNNFRYLTGVGVLSYTGLLDLKEMTFFIMFSDPPPLSSSSKKYVFGAIPNSTESSESSLAGFIFESLNDAGPPPVYDTYFYAGLDSAITNSFVSEVQPQKMFQYDVDQQESKADFVVETSYVNGFSSNGLNLGFGTTRLTTAQGLSLGALYNPDPRAPDITEIGYVYEIIGIAGLITPAGREKMTGYFAWKYGQKPNIPQDNPYILIPPRGTSY